LSHRIVALLWKFACPQPKKSDARTMTTGKIHLTGRRHARHLAWPTIGCDCTTAKQDPK